MYRGIGISIYNMKPTLLFPALAGTVLLTACGQKEESKRPNILFCIADDVSYPHASIYGTRWVNTPAFDRVAREGLLFENVYTCNAKSAPSRSSIITGRNSWQLEAAANHWPEFPAKFTSFAEVLLHNGYYTGGTGKGWGPGIAVDVNGVDRELTGKMWQDIKLQPPTAGISDIDYAANFKEFLKNRPKGQPFCFWYGSLEPHRKYEYASSIRYGKNIADIDSVPAFWPDNETVRTDMLDYALEIEHFDNHLGMMLQALEEAGELDNTLIVVTSDHGMPFPRCKGQEYEYSNHVPFAVMWKKGVKKTGRKVTELVSFIDLAPTFLEVAEIEEKTSGMQPIEGRSMTELFGSDAPVKERDFVLIGKERHDIGRPYDRGYPIRGIIKNGYLYLLNFEPTRWPSGNPEVGYANVDGSPTKTECIRSRTQEGKEQYWQLSFGKRKTEELYHIETDRECMFNLVHDSTLEKLKESMKREMLEKLTAQNDPRIIANGSIFDNYPFMGQERNAWNRMKAGEVVNLGFLSPTDFEPAASGLPVDWEEY